MAILVLFEQFSSKLCFCFLAPNFECFTKYDALCSRSFDYARFRRLRHIVMKRFEIMKKIYSSKALLKMAGEGKCIPHIPPLPLDPPLPSLFGFARRAESVNCSLFLKNFEKHFCKFTRNKTSSNTLKIYRNIYRKNLLAIIYRLPISLEEIEIYQYRLGLF